MHAGAVGVVHTVAVGGLTFEVFYAAHRSSVVALAYSLSGSRWAAEELAQDAFAEALRRWEEVGRYDDPAGWVKRVVANRSVSAWRRRGAELRAVTRLGARRVEPLPAVEPMDREFWGSLRALPKRQAQVLALRYLEDLDVAEIAVLLEIAEPTVRVHLHRGRRALAARLGVPGPTDDDSRKESS